MKDTQIRNLRSRVLITLSFAFLALLISLIYLLYMQQQNSLKTYKEITKNFLHKSVNYSLGNNINRYKIITQRIIEHYNLPSYIVQNDRVGFYEALEQRFVELQEENSHFKTMHFVKSDGTSFVRMHQKGKFGDNIAQFRPMLQQILQDQKILIGYESGLYATVFRILVPIFDNGTFLGSFGIGIEPNFFMEHISRIVKYEGALFIKKEKLNLFSEHQDFDLSLQDFALQTHLEPEVMKIFRSLPREYNFQDTFTLNYHEKTYLIHAIDVEDFEQNSQGKFLFMEDITNIVKQNNRSVYLVATLALFFIIPVYLLIRRYFLKFDSELHESYQLIIQDLETHRRYLTAIEDNSASIIITTYNDKIYSANKLFFEFTQFETLEEFGKKYQCICDLFIPRYGYLERMIEGEYWIDYIINHPDHLHKVIMLYNNKERIFKVTSSKITINSKVRYVSTFVDITDIEEIKNRLSYAINGSKDGLWDWNLQTNEIYFSPRWKEMLGYEADELPNLVEEWRKRVHPEDLEKTLKDIQKNNEKKSSTYDNIHRLKAKSGKWVWIHDRGQTMFDDNGKAIRMVGFHTDITKQMKEQEYLNIQAKRAEALLELPKDAEDLNEQEFIQKGKRIAKVLTKSEVVCIYFVDEKQKEIILSTPSCKEKALKIDYKENFAIDQKTIWSKVIQKQKPIVENNSCNLELELERFIITPVVENKKVVMITVAGNKKERYSFLDIETIQLISNDIYRTVQRKRDTQEMIKKDKIMLAQSRNAAMGEMISMIAHQWRQPLAIISMDANNILANIELDIIDQEGLKEISEEIVEQTQELSATIDDFKNFFKPQKYYSKVFIHEVVEKSMKVIGKSLENNNIFVQANVATQKEIETFPRELMQVFINIINNAKEVLLQRKIEDKKIKIEAIEEKNLLTITIEDNGGGVLLDDTDKIFEPYFSTKDEKVGTGLGLYMSKVIIEKHLLGTLNVYNSKEGAVFVIKIPYIIKNKKDLLIN